MYCKNCGKTLNQGELFCANCGTKVEVIGMSNDFNNNEKNAVNSKIEKMSKIAFTIFIIIMVANIVIYPLSLTDDESSGMFWFFIVLLPSIPLFFVSLVLSIISVKDFFSKKIQYNQITKSRKVFVYLNIIQLFLMLITVILIFKYLTRPY